MKRGLRTLLCMFVAVACVVGSVSPGLAAGKCLSNKEMRADRARTLQSGLMFAALKCIHKPHLELQEKYNAVMKRFGKDLAAQSRVVQGYFRRTQGVSHRKQLHKYVTGMANRYSVASFSAPQFCEDMAALGEDILTGEDDVIMNARFDTALLLPSYAPSCAAKDNPTLVVLNQRVPDLVSIHMPDIDVRLRMKAQAQY